MMKSFLSASLFLFVLTVSAQDLIITKTGDDIESKVLEIGQSEIKYKKFDNIDGPTYGISKSEVILIRFENGTKEVFTDEKEDEAAVVDMFDKGKQDADIYYTGRNSGAVWTGVTTVLLSPLIGIIPAALCASSSPSDQNLNYPDRELIKDYRYYDAYSRQAHKTKKKSIWTSFGISSGIWLILILLL